MSGRHIVVNIDGYNALVAECERLSSELDEANRKLDAWQRYDDEEVKPERATLCQLNMEIAAVKYSRDE